MRDHWSLVLFTLLFQSAVGSIWCMQAALLGCSNQIGLPQIQLQLIAALCLTIVGLGGAFLHLGKPLNSVHAARNLKRSWLSREVTLVSLFAGSLAVLFALAFIHPSLLNGWMLSVVCVTGGIALYAMTRVYLIRTVPSWNHAGTPLAFLSSTLLLGALQCTVVLYGQAILNIGSPNALGESTCLEMVFFVVALTGFTLKLLAAGFKPTAPPASGIDLRHQPTIQAGGLALWFMYILTSGNPAVESTLLFLTAISMITGEVIHRIQFYASHKRVGI